MSLILLSSSSIQKYITFIDELKIEIFENIDSTNTYLKQKKCGGIFYACLAEQQTKGRGRFGRDWFSPFGANIYLSLAWEPTNHIFHNLGGFSLMMGLAIIETLFELGIFKDLMIKWPNDILWQGGKLAGILIEMNKESQDYNQLVVGIGMNVNMPESWTSIYRILGTDQDRNKIVGILLNYLVFYIKEFNEKGFSEKYMELWKTYDFLLNKPLALKLGNRIINGMAMGIDRLGHLILQHDDGEIKTYAAGEVTTNLGIE